MQLETFFFAENKWLSDNNGWTVT